MTIGRFVGFRSAIGACAVIAVLTPSGPANARDLASSGTLKATTDAADACRETLPIMVHAPAAAAFTGDRKALQKLIGGLRAILGFECDGKAMPSVLIITGLVGSETVYRGTAAASARWALVDLPEPSQETPAAAVTVAAAPVHRCDTLAAHPDDPDKASAVAGVTDMALEIEAAFDACVQAVEAFPEEPRFAFELGRALMLGGAKEEAVGFLSAAAAGGSAAALAYLGDLEEDSENALELYRVAAEGGFVPAAALVTAMEQTTGTQETTAGNPGAACDALAAHPEDPAKPAKVAGITDEALDSLAATEACIQAVAVDPDNARTRFQLGRALYLGDLKPEATQELKLASDGGNAAAMAYLAELTDDDGEAQRLVQASASAGFKPAQTALTEQSEAVSVESAGGGFHRNDLIEAILSNRDPGILSEDDILFYMSGFFVYIKENCQSWPGTKSSITAVEIYVARASGRSADITQNALYAGGPAETWAGVGNKVRRQQQAKEDIDEKIQVGIDDGYYFTEDHGCAGKQTKKFVANFVRIFQPDGERENTFMRTCQVGRTNDQCMCVYKIATAALGDVSKIEYTDQIFTSIARQNPLYGIAVLGCAR